MKKIVALLLALMMACSLTCALADASEAIGEWYLTELEADGTRMSVVGMIEMTMVLNEDGTASSVAIVGGDSQEGAGTWTSDGDKIIVTMNNEPAEFTVVDGTLTGDMDGAIAYFSKEAPEAPAAPQAVAAESEEAFLGNWKCVTISMEGLMMPAEMMGMNVTYAIEAGKAVATATDSEGDTSSEYTTAFADGALALTPTAEGEEPQTLVLNDNGQISFEAALGELVMGFYFDKVVE